jgi:dipeptidyl aminopeptidase/acylaminoacyl peptidase
VLGRDARGRAVVWWVDLIDGSSTLWRSVEGGEPSRVEQVRSARSRVGEYGGGAVWASGEDLYWVEDDDQRVRRLDPSGRVSLLTPEPPAPRHHRHAAGAVHPGGAWMVVERELHGVPGAHEAVNELAAVACAAAPDGGPVPPVSLVRGADFVASPALSPDGAHLAWLQWDHPDMPWDAAELWAGALVVPGGGGVPVVRSARRVAGGRADADAAALGRAVSVCLPAWSPDGVLHFCDDRADPWLLRCVGGPGLPAEGSGDRAAAVFRGEGEVGEPRWVAGGSRYGFPDASTLLLAETVAGVDRLWRVDRRSGAAVAVEGIEPTWVSSLVASDGAAAVVVGRATVPTTVVALAPGPATALRPPGDLLAPGSVSVPEPVTFPTGPSGEGPEVAHGLFHAPRLEGVTGPPGECPPLVVRIHGGPTAHHRPELSASVQFWTTRGFAVLEVNYRGSTGFGRAYRDLLHGQWGVTEVQDCIAGAAHLAATGRVDPRRCVIRGGSAGGFTALEALCAPDGPGGFRFAAATSLYGVTDLMALAGDTHKFESRYLDALVGPLPEAEAVYHERSPGRHPERIAAPVLVLQGLEDPVVPPSQAEGLVAALEANGIDHEYRAYAGEGHGLRDPANVADALAAELAFYGRVLGFTPSR